MCAYHNKLHSKYSRTVLILSITVVILHNEKACELWKINLPNKVITHGLSREQTNCQENPVKYMPLWQWFLTFALSCTPYKQPYCSCIPPHTVVNIWLGTNAHVLTFILFPYFKGIIFNSQKNYSAFFVSRGKNFLSFCSSSLHGIHTQYILFVHSNKQEKLLKRT